MPVRRLLSAVLPALVAAAFWSVGPPPITTAAADVVHGDGYDDAEVDGYRSWFGSYRMGDLGTAWCVDHGSRAPDPDLHYEPTDLPAQAEGTKRAIAWALGRHGPGAGRVEAAALMLVLHDLMGATYPSGRIDVDTLPPERLSGFDGDEHAVLARARAIKADAVARAGLAAPWSLSVAVELEPGPPGASPGPYEGAIGVVVARVADAAGTAVPGALVRAAVTGAELTGDVHVLTDAAGVARFPFVAGAGANHLRLVTTLPGPLQAFRPTVEPAQRVARPTLADAEAVVAFEAPPLRRLRVVKGGDAIAYLPVAGARFAVAGVGEVTTGDDGRTPPLALPPGRYTVHEIAPPPGYAPAGPWEVDVAGDDVDLEVLDHAITGRIVVRKIDASSGAPLDGARFSAAYDADADGTFETPVALDAPLLPGRYEVVEREAPVGYRRDPVPRHVLLGPGATEVVEIANVPIAEDAGPTTTVRAPDAPAPTPAPPRPAPAPELPRTGWSPRPLLAVAAALVGGGAALLAAALTPAASSSGRRGRRGPRRRRSGAVA